MTSWAMQIFFITDAAGFAVKINGPIPSLENPMFEKRILAGNKWNG